MSNFGIIYILECFKNETHEPIEEYKYIGCSKYKNIDYLKYNFFKNALSDPKKYNSHLYQCLRESVATTGDYWRIRILETYIEQGDKNIFKNDLLYRKNKLIKELKPRLNMKK